jgi:hypothetical protein
LTRKKGAAAVIEQWSRDGRLLSTPVSIPTANLHGIAVDPKDGTLWVVRLQNAVGVLRLENFDSSGRRLGSFETDWPHALLPASGAEFAWIRR